MGGNLRFLWLGFFWAEQYIHTRELAPKLQTSQLENYGACLEKKIQYDFVSL